MITFTLYSKPGCHLCDVMKSALASAMQGRPYELVIRNILDDPADHAAYKHDIPVLVLRGSEICRHRLNQQRLEEVLRQGA